MRIELRASEAFGRRLDAVAVARGLNRSQMIKAAVMEASVEAGGAVGDVPERDELLSLLGEAARGGSVTAMKALLDERRRDGDDDSEKKPAVSVIDQLAERRAAGG